MAEVRLSELYGKDVFSVDAKYLGRAVEFILDLEQGVVKLILFVTREEIQKHIRSSQDPEERQKFILENSVPYKNVLSVGDVILVKKAEQKKVFSF